MIGNNVLMIRNIANTLNMWMLCVWICVIVGLNDVKLEGESGIH